MTAAVVNLAEKHLHAPNHYLGPAEVLKTGRRLLDVRLPSGEETPAELALAFPYEPEVGDLLLVIGSEGAFYVIGVIEGSGSLSLSFKGDVDLHAEEGALNLIGDHGVNLRGPTVEVLTDKLSLFATAAVQKFSTLHQRVRELLTVHARESHSVTDETSTQRAKKHAVVAEETASVNGRQIMLG